MLSHVLRINPSWIITLNHGRIARIQDSGALMNIVDLQ